MALLHDAYTFESAKHGVLEFGPLETPLIQSQFNGVYGIGIIADESKVQQVWCRAWIEGYESVALLQAAVDAIQLKQGQLTGTLTVSGPAAIEVPKCTFAAFDPERPFFDGALVHGWVCRGRLVWIRRG